MIEERVHLLPLAKHGFELAEISFPRVDGLGCVRLRTNLYSVPVKPGRTVEVRLYPSYLERGTKAAVSPATNAATNGSNKCWTWNTTSTCWSESRARWRDRNRSRRGANEDCGRRVTIDCSTAHQGAGFPDAGAGLRAISHTCLAPGLIALVKPARFERQSARPYEALRWRAEGTNLLFILMEEQS